MYVFLTTPQPDLQQTSHQEGGEKKKENIFLKLFISNLLALAKVVILNIL